MSDNFFYCHPSKFFEGYPDGTTTGQEHLYVNDRGGFDEQPDHTTGYEGPQGHTQAYPPHDDHQQSQASIQYPQADVPMCQDDAYHRGALLFDEVGDGHRQAANYQETPQYEGFYPAPCSWSDQVHGPSFTSDRLDDQYLEIGGQFSPPVDPSRHTRDPQGGWSIERNIHDVGGYSLDAGQPASQSCETWADAKKDLEQTPGHYLADINRYERGHGRQQSMLMASLGRQPGYQEELVRAMDRVQPGQVGYPAASNTVAMLPFDPALDGNYANIIPPQMYEAYPPIEQCNVGYRGLPSTVVSGPKRSDYESLELQTNLMMTGQPQVRKSLQPPGRVASPSSPVVTSDALHCSHEGCKAEFNKKWGKNNLARHIRMKHRNGGRRYECEADGCESVFQRMDARLKHYRKEHSHLAPKPLMPRKASTSTGIGSGWEHLGGSSNSYSLTSLSDSQAFDDCDATSSFYEIESESCHSYRAHPSD